MRYQVAEQITIRTPEGARTIEPGVVLALPVEKAARLVESGKVIPIHLQDDHQILAIRQARRYFEQAITELAKKCPKNFIAHLKAHRPEVWAEVDEAQEVINEYWVALHTGEKVLQEFKMAVQLFKNKILKGAGNSCEGSLRQV